MSIEEYITEKYKQGWSVMGLAPRIQHDFGISGIKARRHVVDWIQKNNYQLIA